ncbi:hypothetical protein BGZ75_001281 [Mortierella antarctica]|nr:hypothetical protein BGZ75_001281 [Mortierella antarctica]
MSQEQQAAIIAARAPRTAEVRHLYSDGSLMNAGKKECSMSFGVVGEQQQPIRAKTTGFASSTKAELMGLIAAILAVAPDQDLIVHLDNKAVVTQFQTIVLNRDRASVREKLRSNNYLEWGVVHRICSERTGNTKVEWVRGHNDDYWNERADVEAKAAQRDPGTAWTVDITAQEEARYAVQLRGITLECDTRNVLKMQTTRRWHQRWRAQKRTKNNIPDYDKVDWPGTLAIAHDNKAVNTFFSSQNDTRARTHRIKKLHGMLPTMDVMRQRRPDLYPDNKCRICTTHVEDNEHVWICPATRAEQDVMWKEATDRIHQWGRTATATYNRERKKQWEKKGGRRPTTRTWYKPILQNCILALKQLIQWPIQSDGQWTLDRKDPWTVYSICRGLVPEALAAAWQGEFRNTTTAIAQSVVRKFCRFVESEAREKLWIPRCKGTIEWETSRGITARKKRGPPEEGARLPWKLTYGRVVQDDECQCGQKLQDHMNNKCPGEQDDPNAADQAILDSLMGRRHPGIMERRGKMIIKSFEEE